MPNADRDKQSEPAERTRRNAEKGATPGSKGYPEPGSGHDESKTVTVEDGPPIKKTDGEPGAFGDVQTGDREP
jgi:hypothetical protein